MGKNKNSSIEKFRLIFSLVTLTLTILGVLKGIMNWSDDGKVNG